MAYNVRPGDAQRFPALYIAGEHRIFAGNDANPDNDINFTIGDPLIEGDWYIKDGQLQIYRSSAWKTQQFVATDDSVTFNNVTVTGTLTATLATTDDNRILSYLGA